MDTPDGEVVSEVPVVPCTEPHDDEVYFDFQLADGEFPGDDAVAEQSDAGCLEQFQPFVGLVYDSSPSDGGELGGGRPRGLVRRVGPGWSRDRYAAGRRVLSEVRVPHMTKAARSGAALTFRPARSNGRRTG